MSRVGFEVPPDALGTTSDGRSWKILNPLAQNGNALFAVVADWCGHCQELKRQIKEAQNMSPFPFFYMNGDKDDRHRLQTNRMNIEGFPTMYTVALGGQLVEYNGGRDARSLARAFGRPTMW